MRPVSLQTKMESRTNMKLRTRRNRCWLRQAPLLTDGVAESIPETIAEESLWQYLAFVCLVASLPFGWLSLGTFMGLNVRPAHLASLFLVITHLPQMRRYHPRFPSVDRLLRHRIPRCMPSR